MKTVRIEGKVQWKCAQAEGGNWVGICDALKLTIQAATWADLMEEIGGSLNAIFRDLLKSNELHKFLEDRGWKPLGPLPHAGDSINFDIPFLPSLTSRDREIGLS